MEQKNAIKCVCLCERKENIENSKLRILKKEKNDFLLPFHVYEYVAIIKLYLNRQEFVIFFLGCVCVVRGFFYLCMWLAGFRGLDGVYNDDDDGKYLKNLG